MSRQNPTSFAFGMLFEIAAVVVIVSLLPRFDLRPQTAASEPGAGGFSTRLAELTAPPHEAVVMPTGFATSEEPRKGLVFTEPKIGKQLSTQEVEDRLDRASQGLVNTLGSAAANTANDLMYSAGRSAPPLPNPPSLPTAEATSPSFTYLPPQVTTDSWIAARPVDAKRQVTPIQSQQPWFESPPTTNREQLRLAPPPSVGTLPGVATRPPNATASGRPDVSQLPRRWTNY